MFHQGILVCQSIPDKKSEVYIHQHIVFFTFLSRLMNLLYDIISFGLEVVQHRILSLLVRYSGRVGTEYRKGRKIAIDSSFIEYV